MKTQHTIDSLLVLTAHSLETAYKIAVQEHNESCDHDWQKGKANINRIARLAVQIARTTLAEVIKESEGL